MTGTGVRRVFQRLGWRRLEAAARLGKNEKTIRRWQATGAPPHVARVLRDLAAGHYSPEEAATALSGDVERRSAA
jgi:hypothetical protein